jgi:hypothetical protein
MFTGARPLVVSALALVLAGCGGHVLGRGGNPDARGSTAATVLNRAQLSHAPSLISAITNRLPGIQVQSGNRRCPEIALRGRKSITGDNSPAVYVDGTRAVNTCVLEMLHIADVSRIEIYPMGIAPRLPYKGHPNGLILVFLADGRTD